jgi:CHAT domain
MTLEAIRSRALKGLRRIPGVPSAIVTVPSVYRHLSIGHLRRGASRGARLAVRNVLRQQQYTALRAPVEDHQAIHDDDFARAALLGRAQELAMYTTALSISAASLGCPVLRCPPQVDRIRELLLRLSGVRGDSQASAQRRNRLALRIGDALHAAIPRQIVKHIQRHQHQGVKFVGDTPLELLRIDDLPVGLAGTTSRLPTLPGNLLMRQALVRAPHLLTAEDFRQVLIVRTFEPNDPLRGMLDIALRGFEAELAGRIDIRIVDVSTKDEFVAGFNGFDGTLAIFDGHGRHERGARNGTLAVGPLEIDLFELYHHIKVPSIVWLSACETHPLDGVENSVASAFLFMGARSVLGSNMPISGPNGALLVGRFLYRLADFLPMLNATIPWAEVVSGMLRMSYVTDILRAMKEPLLLTDDAYRTVHTRANTAINMFRPDWFPSLLDDIARATGTDVPTIRDLWLRSCYFTDTLRYVHLGVPEHMFVVPNDN